MSCLLTLATALLLALRTHLLSSLTLDLSFNLSTLKDILSLLYRETTALYYTPLMLPLLPLFLFIYYL